MSNTNTDNDLIELFITQNGPQLEKAIHEKTVMLEPPVALEAGPLNKDKATIQLEKVIKAFLTAQADPEKPPIEFTIDSKRIYTVLDGHKVDVSALLLNANLSHLSFSMQDADNYMIYINKKDIEFGPSLLEVEGTPTMDDYQKREANSPHPNALKELNLAEKTAINIYTGGFYKPCNDLLRGLTEGLPEISSKELGEILATVTMSCVGLNKISESTTSYSFRVEEHRGAEFSQNRISAVQKGGSVMNESAFFSTASGLPSDPFVTEMNKELMLSGAGNAVLLSGLIGKYVAAISKQPDENEYLIPPTQMQWTGHYQTPEGANFFIANPVRTPTLALTAEQLKGFSPTATPESVKPAKEAPIMTDSPDNIASTNDFKQKLHNIRVLNESNDEDSDNHFNP